MTKHPIIGVFMVLLGAYFMAVGSELVTDEGVRVPLWVMFFIGLLFLLVGFVLIRGKTLPQKSLVASIMLLCFSMVGFGIGFFQETGIFAKWVFGASSTICLLLSLLALRDKD